MDQDLYQRIVAAFKQTGSVDRTAQLCDTYAIKVRKVLITEGLWHSKKSDAVNALRERGYSVSEIAEALGMEEKNVQFYLPYSENYLSGERTDSSERVAAFRQRSRKAADASLTREQESAGRIAPPTNRKKERQQPPKRIKDEFWDKKNRPQSSKKEKWDKKNRPQSTIFQLKVELVKEEEDGDLFRGEPDAEALRALVKTKDGISREILVPGKMNLHQLNYAIQEAFGFMNCHLHHFSLPEALFRQLTEEETGKWAEMCGVYLHVPVEEDFSDLYWDDDYKQGKSAKAWMRSKYTGTRKNYAVGETYIDSLRLLKEEAEWIQEEMEADGDTRRFQDLPMEEYIREFLFGEINAVLERLSVEELFMTQSLPKEETDAWRDAMREDIEVSLSYLEAFKKTKSFKSLEEAMSVLRLMRENRDSLDKAIWTNREEMKELYGMNPELVLEDLEDEIKRTEGQIGDAMHAFDPPTRPITNTLYFHYDYGDDWLFKITCREIYTLQSNQISEKETETALKKAKKQLTTPNPTIENKLIACDWGKDYQQEYTFTDTKNRELHNMLYRPLCTAYLEKRPVCTHAEGLSLIEDVGGPTGFFEFIRDIHGNDPDNAPDLREWARSKGWKETVPKPAGLL